MLSSGIIQFFSERVVSKLQVAGVKISPIAVPVIKRKTTIGGYFCCESALVELTSEKHFEICYYTCSACDGRHYRPEQKYKREVQRQNQVYHRDRWPEGAGVVYDVLSGSTFYSDRFVEVCTSGDFSGMGFSRKGRWI